MGRAMRKPCTYIARLPARQENCAGRSTPSAVTSRPRPSQSLMSAAVTAAERRLVSIFAINVRSSLMRESGSCSKDASDE